MADIRVAVLFLCLTFTRSNIIPLNCDLKKQFIDAHNSLRLKVAKGEVSGQPAASKMTSLIWDEELAKKAENWARNNKFAHNPVRTVPSKRFGLTGENLHIYGTTRSDPGLQIESSINSWFDEHKYFIHKPMTAQDFQGAKSIGHYTQLVWEKTHYIGCAITRFKERSFNKVLVVCNYGPTGNMLGQAPYPSGKPSNQLVCVVTDCTKPYGENCPKPDATSVIFQ